jgi:ABC-type thiamine transport system substrate-binding protein
LEEISWDEWFRAFDENQLAFVYEDETVSGKRSTFNKLVSRETARERAHR